MLFLLVNMFIYSLLFSEKERKPHVDIDICCIGVGRTKKLYPYERLIKNIEIPWIHEERNQDGKENCD